MTTPSPLESRLARVERALAALSTEVAAIRAELGTPAANGARAEQPVAREASAQRSARLGRLALNARDAERLIGSYGMLGISVLAAVAAVGTFLSWAIGRGYLILGPPARVTIGLVFAATIGVWGSRLRRRERSFGSSLMGLALVIVHVCAYAAGTTNNSYVKTWNCGNYADQKWLKWDLGGGYFRLQNMKSKLCMVHRFADYGPVQQYTCGNYADQTWGFIWHSTNAV